MDRQYFQEICNEIAQIEPPADGEAGYLLERLAGGDFSVEGRLIEMHLGFVLDTARAREGCGVPVGDLMQEGNLALVDLIEKCKEDAVIQTEETFLAFLHRKIEQAMDRLVEDSRQYRETSDRMAADANRMLAVTRRLEEELGRAATLSELAREMGENEDYVEELVRVSKTAMDNAAG